MTDHDRGAYTPQPDAPLQFDARGPRGRKPMPMTLIGSGVVLVVLLGALALHYRQDTKVRAEGPRPVGEPIAKVKGAAPPAAQPKDAGGGIDVFGGGADEAKVPVLAPPPEPPKPRPQLTVQTMDGLTGKPTPVTTTATATPPPVKATAAVAKAAPLKTAPIYVAPVVPAKPDATSIINNVAATPPAKPAPARLATTTAKVATAANPTATKPATAAGGAVVQIGAFSSSALSDKGFADVSTAMVGAMGGKTKRVETLEKDGKTLYRTSVVGFPSRAAADAFCKALAAKGHNCFAKG